MCSPRVSAIRLKRRSANSENEAHRTAREDKSHGEGGLSSDGGADGLEVGDGKGRFDWVGRFIRMGRKRSRMG